MSELGSIPVAILCGGRGTRLNERTTEIPKPLVEIGGRPILWHVIQIYASYGATRFILCAGYKGEAIKDFVRETEWEESIQVECVDTGIDTPTGGRVAAVADRLAGGTFGVTYADGVAGIDLEQLLRFHQGKGQLATVTAVRPELPFGVMQLDGGTRVEAFVEKPTSEHWINGGFFFFEEEVLNRLSEDSVLEREPLESLAAEGQLVAYRYDGFWKCMDTYKDAVELNDIWAAGDAPWRVWSE